MQNQKQDVESANTSGILRTDCEDSLRLLEDLKQQRLKAQDISSGGSDYACRMCRVKKLDLEVTSPSRFDDEKRIKKRRTWQELGSVI